MEGSVRDLSRYRLQKAREDLETARDNLANGRYRASMIDSCFRLREKADYDDFFLVARDDAVMQLEKAEYVLSAVEQYITATLENKDLA